MTFRQTLVASCAEKGLTADEIGMVLDQYFYSAKDIEKVANEQVDNYPAILLKIALSDVSDIAMVYVVNRSKAA